MRTSLASFSTHSFAKTPLKAAHPPLAMATTNQVDREPVVDIREGYGFRWKVEHDYFDEATLDSVGQSPAARGLAGLVECIPLCDQSS
jgi:hypothetical protein